MTKTAPDEPLHALQLLAEEIGAPKKLTIATIVKGTSDTELVAVGSQIDTRRIVTDAIRIYGKAWEFWQEAGPEAQKRLRGFSRDLLALAIAQAINLETTRQAVAGKSSGDSEKRAAAEAAASGASEAGMAIRDQAFDALRDAGQTPVYRDEAGAAVGTAEDATALAEGIDALGKLLTRWLGSKDADLVGRLAGANLDEGYAKELADAAKLVRTTAATAGHSVKGKVTQGALDREDGVNLLLLGQIIRAFEGAHNRNPTVPRLVPISTRRMFNRRTKKAAPAPTAGTPVTGDGTGKS